MNKVIATGRSVTAVDVIIADRLRERRQELGVSQQALAALVGTTFQQIQKYESATNRVSASRLFAIAKALDIPMDYFFEPILKAVRGAKRKAPNHVVVGGTPPARKTARA